ncbi:MAG: redoxin family protein [Saprospiraceae bacterium]
MKYLILILAILSNISLFGQLQSIKVDIKGYTNDTLILGNYYGEKQIVKDTIFRNKKGTYEYTTKDTLAEGMYLVMMKPNNNFIQFLISPNEKAISIIADTSDLANIKFKNSPENNLFYEFLNFLKDKRTLADSARAKIERAKAKNLVDKEAENQLNSLDVDVKAYQKNLLDHNPKSLTAFLLKSNMDIDIPEFEGAGDSLQMKRYHYYKKHYFDNINMQHPALIRMPFTYPKIDTYLSKLSPQIPDSLKLEIDRVLSLLEGNNEAYRYFLADLLNKYAQMKVVGFDGLYVHLVENYYSKGKAPWVDQENIKKMQDNANDLSPILIGKTIPNVVIYKEDGTPMHLHDVEAPYTVLIFWAPECGHCQKVMPFVVDFEKKHRDKGVKVVSICTKGGEKFPECWKAVKEKGMEAFINTGDEYQRFNRQIKTKSTPKIFILDQNKKILIKDIPGEEIDKIFEEVFKFEEQKKLEKH